MVKKKRIRILSLVVSVFMLISLISACGTKPAVSTPASDSPTSTPSASSTPESQTPAEKVKLTWWTKDRHDMDYMKEVVAKFTQDNPNIEIDYNIQTENYPQNLELAFQSGQAPDIFVNQQNAKYYVDRKMAEPLDGYLSDEMKARFGKLINVEFINTVGDKIYSLPNGGITFRLVYNKDLFAKANLPGPPKTVDEMVEYAKKITEAGKADGAYGFAINMKNPNNSLFRCLDQVAFRSNAYYYDYKTGQYNFEPTKPIIAAFAKMYADGSMFPGIEGLDMDPMRSQFAEGKIGMYISGNWEVGVYANQFPPKCDWGATPVPTLDGTSKAPSEIRNAGSYLYMSSESKHKNEAWKVLEYVYSDDVLVPYHEKGFAFSVVPSVLSKAKDAELKGAAEFKTTDGIDGIWPLAPAGQGMKAEGKTHYDVMAEVILGATDLDAAITDLNKRYNEQLEKDAASGKVKKTTIPDFNPLGL